MLHDLMPDVVTISFGSRTADIWQRLRQRGWTFVGKGEWKNEPVLGVSHNSFKIAGAGGTLHFATGDRKATLTLRHPLRRGTHRVTLTGVIADMTLNRLARTGFTFRVP